jgi:pre-mRNA-processing factor 8
MILSDKFLGFFMVPEGGIWNYNFMGINFTQNMKYNLILDNPVDFYNEIHRSSHFIDFAKLDETAEQHLPEKEDFYA